MKWEKRFANYTIWLNLQNICGTQLNNKKIIQSVERAKGLNRQFSKDIKIVDHYKKKEKIKVAKQH